MSNYCIFFTLALLSICGCSSCFPNGASDCEKHYDFTIPMTISPAKDTFHIGDTIWVESIVSNHLTNKLDGEEADIASLFLKFDMAISTYKDNKDVFADHFFNYVDVIGHVYPGQVFTRMVYEDSLGHRKLKFGVIPKSTGNGSGLFLLSFDYVTYDYAEAELLNEDCLDIINFWYQTNEERDSSRYALLPSVYPNSRAQFSKAGSFVFRVVE